MKFLKQQKKQEQPTGCEMDYQSVFFKDSEEKTRDGKVVYIRKKYHERLMKILQMVGGKEITLFSYLDNILEYHFDLFRDEIREMYQEKNTDDFLNP